MEVFHIFPMADGRGLRQHARPRGMRGFLVEHEETRLALPVQVNVTAEVARAQEQVGDQGDVGQEHQSQHPCERTLRRPGVHHRVHGGEHAGDVQAERRDGDQGGDHARAVSTIKFSATVFGARRCICIRAGAGECTLSLSFEPIL
jgi:hypothetical protein